MRNVWLGWIVFWALCAIQGCRTPSPNWNGTWKVNPVESSYQGPVYTISISTGGGYHFNGGKAGFTLRCDGKDQQIANNRTQVCTKSGATANIVLEESGIKTKVTHWELSDGGNVFTSTVTAFEPNGHVTTSQTIFSRLSGTNDFAGQWRDTSYLQQRANMALRLDSQYLHVGYPSAGQHIDAPIDGADAAAHGPNATEGVTYAVRPAGKRKFLILTKRSGKVLTQGTLELSNDGKVVINSWWSPDKPSAKATLVYDKQ